MFQRLQLFIFQAFRYVYVSVFFKFNLAKKIKIRGVEHPIYLRRNTSDIPTFNQLFTFKEYDIHLKFEPKNILDIGANIGLAAVFFSNKYPNAKIISIEPEKSNFEMILKNIQKYKNVTPHKRAISNQANVVLNVVDDGIGNWGFMTETEEVSNAKNIIDTVKTITITEIMKENNLESIDILKIDIESAEKELFSSDYEYWLPKTKCLIIELHDWMKEGCSKSFFNAISKYNFSYSQKGENLIFVNKDKL